MPLVMVLFPVRWRSGKGGGGVAADFLSFVKERGNDRGGVEAGLCFNANIGLSTVSPNHRVGVVSAEGGQKWKECGLQHCPSSSPNCWLYEVHLSPILYGASLRLVMTDLFLNLNAMSKPSQHRRPQRHILPPVLVS